MLRAKGLAYEVFRPQLDTEVQLSTDLNVPVRKVNYLRDLETTSINAGKRAEITAVNNPAQIEQATEEIAKALAEDLERVIHSCCR